ncbi:MAG TPA: CHASE2 domain-containing protein [Caulobacteraceae bacterium]|nr:CHASE2 domain-containing protein [Caulobacteraceae bacterium]
MSSSRNTKALERRRGYGGDEWNEAGAGRGMFDPLRKAGVVLREIGGDVARYWRRAMITFLCGAVVLVLIRQPFFQQSILGEPDREMMTAAFNLRSDVYVGRGDPVLLLDIDNAAMAQDKSRPLVPGREPPASTPRGMVADVLRYILGAAPGRGPKVVMLDVDLAAPTVGDAAGEARLHEVLAAWAADPHAPSLMISRESFPPSLLGLTGNVRTLPTSDYDDIVGAAANIYWGDVKVLSDINGVAVEMRPYECVMDHGRVGPLYASAVLSYAALVNGKVPKSAHVRRWMDGAAARCRGHPDLLIQHGEDIDYHLSLNPEEEGRAWPSLPRDWPGYSACGRDTDPSVFRRISAGIIEQAGTDASTDILCRRLVVIGGTNSISNDFLQTPLGEMGGAMILANATRGLQISHGGLRQIPLPLQLSALAAISIIITVSFTLSRRARRAYRESRGPGAHWTREIVLLPLNPVVLNIGVAFMAHWLGVGLMLIALHLGYWGFLSGPAFGSALAETVQDFTDEQS